MLFILVLRLMPVLVVLAAIFWAVDSLIRLSNALLKFLDQGFVQAIGLELSVVWDGYGYISILLVCVTTYFAIKNKNTRFVGDLIGLTLFSQLSFLLIALMLTTYLFWGNFLENQSLLVLMEQNNNNWGTALWEGIYSIILTVVDLFIIGLLCYGVEFCFAILEDIVIKEQLNYLRLDKIYLGLFLSFLVIENKIGAHLYEVFHLSSYRALGLVFLITPLFLFVIAVFVNHFKSEIYSDRIRTYPLKGVKVLFTVVVFLNLIVLFFPTIKNIIFSISNSLSLGKYFTLASLLPFLLVSLYLIFYSFFVVYTWYKSGKFPDSLYELV